MEFDLSRTLAQSHADRDPAALVGPVFCRIREQFIQSQREWYPGLFRQRPGGRFIVDRNLVAEEGFGIVANGFKEALPAYVGCMADRVKQPLRSPHCTDAAARIREHFASFRVSRLVPRDLQEAIEDLQIIL